MSYSASVYKSGRLITVTNYLSTKANAYKDARNFIRHNFPLSRMSEFRIVIKNKKGNPGIPKNKWIKAKAVKFCSDGRVQVKR